MSLNDVRRCDQRNDPGRQNFVVSGIVDVWQERLQLEVEVLVGYVELVVGHVGWELVVAVVDDLADVKRVHEFRLIRNRHLQPEVKRTVSKKVTQCSLEVIQARD